MFFKANVMWDKARLWRRSLNQHHLFLHNACYGVNEEPLRSILPTSSERICLCKLNNGETQA